jgi:enediyne biosynthesis protein E4
MLSGMGVDAEDVNGDGRPDLYVTNFTDEYNTLYLNNGKALFLDSTLYFGLAADTIPWVGWGTALADLDNDGWPDNFVTNGQVDDNRRQLGQPIDYQEPALLFVNRKGQQFRLATRDAGPYFDTPHVGRGAAFGDFDDDGDIDIAVNHKDAAPALLRNDSKNDHRWIRLELRGTKSNRDAIGARVAVVAGDLTFVRQRKGGYSMMSSHDPRLLIGVGRADEVDQLTVRWPSGAVSRREHLRTGRSYQIVEPED